MNANEVIKPQYLQGLATLFWGYHADLLYFAIPMAIMLEARYFLNRRWALETKDFYLVADLTSFGLVALVGFLFLNAREFHFITSLLTWLPILFFPLVVIVGYSTEPRMRLDIIFYSLRRQREPVTQSWDMDYVFMGACLLGAGFEADSNIYFPFVGAIVLGSLFRLRSSRFNPAIVVLSVSIIFVSATLLHTGIRGAHLALKSQTEQWIANWLAGRLDPMKTRTAIGQVGRMKLSDAIAFRIAPDSGRPDFPALLQEATYNSPSTTNWEVFDRSFNKVEHTDDFRWSLAPLARQEQLSMMLAPEARIFIEFDKERAVIPVPTKLIDIADLPATDVNKSIYGTIQGVGLVPAPHYKVSYLNERFLGDEPGGTDLVIPEDYRELMHEIAPHTMAPQEAVAFVKDYFADFRYTLYQNNREIRENPMGYFLTDSKAGHCEYFASATALMLRQLGVPSRYVVGYAIEEWDPDLEMYIVRRRHAHAWAVAYLDGEWVPVDTTPSVWLGMEEHASSPLQPIWDYLGNNRFLFTLWWNDQDIEDYETELYILGFILLLVLVWRITTSEQVILEEDVPEEIRAWLIPGAESPFFEIEKLLAEDGFNRMPGEVMKRWLLRIGRPELLPMLAYHNRWRFDPHGISIDERKLLAGQVSEWLHQNEKQVESAAS